MIDGYTCHECPYEDTKHIINEEYEIMPNGKHYDAWACDEWLKADLLDLINRQKAEIEWLESEMDKQYETAEASIRAEIASGGTSCHWCEDQIKFKAIKYFAERLCEGRVSNDPIVIAVKVELKEMIGEQE